MLIAAIKILALLAIGVGGGFLISRFLCAGGGCPIMANRPLMALIGGFLALYGAYAFGWLAQLTGGGAQSAPDLPALRTNDDLQAALQSSRPVVIDYYAHWCGPCRAMKPTLRNAQQKWQDRVDFYAVNVDQSPELARLAGVEGIPLLVFFQDGQEVRRSVGRISSAQLDSIIESLNPPPPPQTQPAE